MLVVCAADDQKQGVTEMIDLLGSVLIQLGTVTLAVWGAVELFGGLLTTYYDRPWVKPVLSVFLGPILAATAHVYGFVPAVATTEGAAFAGLIATLTSKIFNDYLAKPVLDRVLGRKPPERREGE